MPRVYQPRGHAPRRAGAGRLASAIEAPQQTIPLESLQPFRDCGRRVARTAQTLRQGCDVVRHYTGIAAYAVRGRR